MNLTLDSQFKTTQMEKNCQKGQDLINKIVKSTEEEEEPSLEP